MAGNDAGEYGDFPLKQYLGMHLDSVKPGHAVAHLDAADDHLNPNGVVHGGVLFSMVDTAMGLATMSVLDDGLICASIEVQLRFLRPALTGRIDSETTIVRQGRRIVHLESRITDSDGQLLATAAGSFAVLEQPTEAT